MKKRARECERRWIEVSSPVRIELILVEDRLVGIGAVTIGGIAVRSGTVPMRPDFSTCDAIHYQDFYLEEIVQEAQGIRLRTQAIGRPEMLSNESMDEYDFTLAFPLVRGAQTAELDWIITSRELDLDGEKHTGFSLGFEFRGGSNEIHRFLTTGTWEIGGRATGNTIYHQSQVAEPVYTAAKDTHYTTACLQRLDLWHHPLGNSYQFCPRWGSMQPFDFQAAPEGVLLGYWPDRHSVKSLIQKNPGEEVVFVLDEYDFALTSHAIIPAKHILFSPSPQPGSARPKHEVVNMWTRAMEYTGDIIRGFFGIKPCVPDPYERLELFSSGKVCVDRSELAGGPKDDWRWREENGRFYFLPAGGDKVESHDLLAWIADHALPELKTKGIRRLWIDPVHESDFTEMAFAYHAQTGWHGDLHVSSVCGTHRYVPSAFFGGWDAWRYLARKARALDISLGHWVGLHLSPRAEILQNHPEFVLRHSHSKMFSGGYGHMSIVALDWGCRGLREWILADLARWHAEGLDWLWFDSWPNLTCLPVSYGSRMDPMQWSVCPVFAELQKIGFNWLGFEGTSPFGVPAYGLADPMQDYEGHVQQGVCGQNDFGKRIGHEYLAYNEALLHIGLNPDRSRDSLLEWSFRFIANRSLNLVTDADKRTYVTLQPLMQKRYLLPADRGVRWLAADGKQEALFAYTAFAHPVTAGAKVTRVTGATEQRVGCPGNVLHTQPRTAYRIS